MHDQLFTQRTTDSADPARCAIGDVAVDLRSELREVVDDFVALYPRRSGSADGRHAPIQLEVRRAGLSWTGRRQYRVFADGLPVGGCRPRDGVFPLLEWGVNLRVMETRCEFLQIHAASMSYRGAGVIFAGDSGCGKSTLAAMLFSRRWAYLCDEFALVDPARLRLNPFPKALCIKEGSHSVVRGLGLAFARRRDYVKAWKGRVGYIDPRVPSRDIHVEAPPVRLIVFPQYRPHARPALERLSGARATILLYRNCFNRHAFPHAALPELTALVRQARCFRLFTGEPLETAGLLEALLDTPGVLANPTTAVRETQPRTTARPRRPRDQSRRELLRLGAKLAYATPAILSLTATQAFAAASDPSGICSTALNTGQVCTLDSQCCSEQCDTGFCR